MTRTHIAALLVLAAAIPAATASFFTSRMSNDVPCLFAGNSGYRMAHGGDADLSVRIDNASATPDLRLQLTDDAAAADFVLVDDGDIGSACAGAAAVQSVRLASQAGYADLTVALSRAPAPYKIYVHSAAFSQQDAAVLFAAIWRNGRKTAGSGREIAARN